tara:strand:+ start:379 stop:1743 length:1365 start_codon:yes stop_codon:yes gene_type:complete
MRKRKKIDSSKFILPSIVIFFSAVLFLSLPVLLNYNSIQNIIEKKISSEFKINLKILDDISLKILPRPHYLVKRANLDLNIENEKSSIIQTKNLRIYIPIRKLYSKSNINIKEIEIEKANIYFKLDDILDFRHHLYYKINKPIYIKKSKFFLLDKNNKTVLISPIKKISYLINNKNNSKEFKIQGNLFDVDYNSSWKRFYKNPKNSIIEIKSKKPNLFIKNLFSFEDNFNFSGKSSISFLKEDIFINYSKKESKIFINSPNENKNQKIQFKSKIELEPFFINAIINFNNQDTNFLVDDLLYFILSSEEYLGNINGKFNLIFNNLNNSIINNGQINISIKEKTVKLENSLFEIKNIGIIKSDFRFYENEGDLIFASENVFEITNKKEFSKKFQISAKNVKNINKIYFDLEKNIDNQEISISNIYLNKIDNENFSEEYFIIENIQKLKNLIRNIIS